MSEIVQTIAESDTVHPELPGKKFKTIIFNMFQEKNTIGYLRNICKIKKLDELVKNGNIRTKIQNSSRWFRRRI